MIIKLMSSTHCEPSSSQHEHDVSIMVNSSSIHSVDDDDDDDGQLETDQVDIISTLCEIGAVTFVTCMTFWSLSTSLNN